MESYQRGQAVVLLNSMVERINANRDLPSNFGAAYVTANPLGTDDAQPADCTGTAMGVARDKCEWSNALKGAAETSGTTRVGAMVGARGCVTEVQARNTTPGVCAPGIYLVTVTWQGLNPTSIPSATCGQGLFGSDDRLRRAISARVSIGLPTCQ
jgi:type IV pilus assembly protein PilV